MTWLLHNGAHPLSLWPPRSLSSRGSESDLFTVQFCHCTCCFQSFPDFPCSRTGHFKVSTKLIMLLFSIPVCFQTSPAHALSGSAGAISLVWDLPVPVPSPVAQPKAAVLRGWNGPNDLYFSKVPEGNTDE